MCKTTKWADLLCGLWKEMCLFSAAAEEQSTKPIELFLLNTQRWKLTLENKGEYKDFSLMCFIYRIKRLVLRAVGCTALWSH